jgi:hypothetical protein
MLHRTRQLDRERFVWDIGPNDSWPTRAEGFVRDIWLNEIWPDLVGGFRLKLGGCQLHDHYITHGKDREICTANNGYYRKLEGEKKTNKSAA